MASIITPLRNTYRYLVRPPTLLPLRHFVALSDVCAAVVTTLYTQTQQRQAHESPVLFYSVVMGAIGPVIAFTVPPIREHLGYRPAEPIPITYPRASFSPLLSSPLLSSPLLSPSFPLPHTG